MKLRQEEARTYFSKGIICRMCPDENRPTAMQNQNTAISELAIVVSRAKFSMKNVVPQNTKLPSAIMSQNKLEAMK
jgi:hypothetical protein